MLTIQATLTAAIQLLRFRTCREPSSCCATARARGTSRTSSPGGTTCRSRAQGEAEAVSGGRAMADAGLRFDVAHTSVLTRAVVTNHLALAELGQVWLPVQRHWRLNERHYGALQGLDKTPDRRTPRVEQTKLWRRSYDVPPPPVADDSPEHPANDRRYRSLATRGAPGDRVPRRRRRPRAPLLARRDRPAAARRSRRARHRPRQLAARACSCTSRASAARTIAEVNIPTGVPRRYQLDDRLGVVTAEYLGDAEAIAAAAAAVAAQASPA